MFEKNTPRDFFLHVGAFITLYLGAIALITLLFSVINYAFPDPLNYYYSDPYSGPMRFAIASLLVLAPFSVYLFYIVQRESRLNPERKSLGVRKWLTYITLFIAGATVLGDLIALLNSFLGGTLPTTFLLKVFVILGVMGAGFGYFFLDIKGYWTTHVVYSKYAGLGVLAVVIASIIGGMMLMGSPMKQRELTLDNQQINDLMNIQSQITEYRRVAGALPENLDVFENSPNGFMLPESPQGRAAYTYVKTSENDFKLCASFGEASVSSAYSQAFDPALGTTVSWEHEAGKVCFERTIDPSFFKPMEVTPVPGKTAPVL